MLPWWGYWIVGGTVVAAIFWAGDNYGLNARKYAECQAETERRNKAIAGVNADETKRHMSEEEKRSADRKEFNAKSPSIGQCLLTGDQAAALNGIGE